jgi:hypothetical protein
MIHVLVIEEGRRARALLLDADREALGMGRYEYLLHSLYQRSVLLREKGPGFDAPRASEVSKRWTCREPSRPVHGPVTECRTRP